MRAFIIVVTLVGCGEVVQQQPDLRKELGSACSAGTDCFTGNCADGVCCNAACDGTCEACVGAKTGADDGVCMPVKANTDPDAECTSTCTADSAEHKTCAGGIAACAVTSTACGPYACDESTISCRTTCSGNADCSAASFCNVNHICAKRLRVALETNPGSAPRTDTFPKVQAALEARGHTVTVVDGTQIDEAAELANFDVVVNGTFGTGTSDDRGTFDAALGPWVNGGGGLVGCGWVLYVAPPANYGALMPASGNLYFTGAQALTPVTTHPIGAGLTTFTAQANYLPYGGTPKSGADVVLTASTGAATGLAWPQGIGRVVFLGPLYLDAYADYANQSLTDGTNPTALEMLIRSIEWAGGSL